MLLLVIVLLALSTAKTASTDDYVVNTPKCKIPNLDPFSEEVLLISKPENYTSCCNSDSLTYLEKVNNTTILHVRQNLVEKSKIQCCYSKVSRRGSAELPDVGIQISKCEAFKKSVRLEQVPVKVQCKENGSVVYENVYHPVIATGDVEEKINRIPKKVKPVSVLFVVIDSVSRLNLIRTMPNTRKFLLNNDFVELKGYNKINDNTFPNVMALLTGLNLDQSREICKPTEVNKLDECPMIWYDYRRLGYATAYAEDHANITTFNYLIKGFTKPPTDYYFKPYVEAAETLKITTKDGMPYCTGPETSGERILNIARDFAGTFRTSPNFGIFWTNTFSHNAINSPYPFDNKLKKFFNHLKTDGIFNNSIVIFLSDHGIRFGDIRLTRTGWFEERLPFSLISVPQFFQQQFPNEFRNLKNNANKLTNTFDLFMTLQHVLVLSGFDYEIKASEACPKCASLFTKIPLNRSCQDAAIPLEWCTCIGRLDPIDGNHGLVTNATAEVLQRIEGSLGLKAPGKCARYSVKRVGHASVSENVDYSEERYLYVNFVTVPEASFLVTVKFREFVDKTSAFHVVRFDNYLKNSTCVGGSLKKFCTCI